MNKVITLVATTSLLLSGCANVGPRQQAGTVIGAGTGALVGAAVGDGVGAAVGAAGGAVIGGAVGRSMDEDYSYRSGR